MAIRFNASPNQYIEFANNALYSNLAQKTILFWGSFDAWGKGILSKGAYNLSGWTIENTVAWGGSFFFDQEFSTGRGCWHTPILLNTFYQVAITYDSSSTSNDPVLYLNGAPVAVTEASAPTGAVETDAAYGLLIGNAGDKSVPLDGDINAVLIYNRILSAQEIEDNFKTRNRIKSHYGLVFAPNLIGAAGNPGDGNAMAAGNTIVDPISHTYGVPSGNPIFLAENQIVSWWGCGGD